MANVDFWTEQVRLTLLGYEEGLLRQIANRLFRPRNQWPVEELVERTLDTLADAAKLDRRIKDLPPACRLVLALIGHGQQPRWAVGSLVEMLMMLGHEDGLKPIKVLIETGLLFPASSSTNTARLRLKNIDIWLAQASGPMVFTLPQVAARAIGEPLGVAEGGTGFLARPADAPPNKDIDALRLRTDGLGSPSHGQVYEADGLDWPLRLAVLWQSVTAAPLRRTMQGDFFKRDLDRLRQEPLLSAQPPDALAEIPDPGLLSVGLALAVGILHENPDTAGELIAGPFPEAWSAGLPAALLDTWGKLPLLRGWNGADGWQPELAFGIGGDVPGNPYPAAHLLSLRLLGQLGDSQWAEPAALEDWIMTRHPFWKAVKKPPAGVVVNFLLGLAYPLRLLQATKDSAGGWLIRLSPLGRWMLGLSGMPAGLPTYPQTLLVQPNLEILAYRQGLTPELIVRLSQFAAWKGLSAACTLQIEPDSVYRALQAGETFASLVQALEQHSMKAIPTAVIESLRTWSNKRDRITVYPSGVLLEFSGPGELAEALARGLPAVRLSDRLAVLPGEQDIDYQNFRLSGTRDYFLLPEKCVDVEADGVTLNVDLAKSDLLLETELTRFAEPLPRDNSLPGRKLYRVTPESVAAGRKNGLELASLQTWFLQRTGDAVPAAARMLLTGPDAAPATLRRQLVLHLPSPELADGLLQWPATRVLIDARLGPNTLSLAEENVPRLRELLSGIGMQMNIESPEAIAP